MTLTRTTLTVSVLLACAALSSGETVVAVHGNSPALEVIAETLGVSTEAQNHAKPSPRSPRTLLPRQLGTADEPPSDDDAPAGKIVGGKGVSMDIRQRMVHIVSTSKSKKIFGCTGSVLARTWVLTAAHCFFLGPKSADKVVPSKSYVLVGEKTTKPYYFESRSNKYQMKAVFLWKSYDYKKDAYGDDVALVQLRKPIKKAQYRPMALGNRPKKGPTNVLVAGYGLRGSGLSRPKKPRMATVVYQDGKICDKALGFTAANYQREICTTSTGFPNQAKTGSCFGDSGGPVVVKKGKKIEQIGITSAFYGDKCQSKGAVDISMQTSFFKKLIYNKVKTGKNKGWKKL